MLVRLALRSEVDAALGVWSDANPLTQLDEHPERLKSWAQQPDAALYVAVEGEDLIGMLLSLPARFDDGAGGVIPHARHITGVAVLPAWRRRGVGRALLGAALDDARAKLCELVTLWTPADNEPARRLFERHGFRPTGRIEEDDAGTPMLHLLAQLSNAVPQQGLTHA